LFSTNAIGQISVDSIASAISRDSGFPESGYANYSIRLHDTLSQLSAEQFSIVFGDRISNEEESFLLDLITQNPPIPPERLEEALLMQSPLSIRVLQEFINSLTPSTPPDRIFSVLSANSPLPVPIFNRVVNGQTSLGSGQITELIERQNN